MLGVKPGLDALGQLDFVGGGEQRRLADAVQVHAHQVRCGALSVQIAVKPGLWWHSPWRPPDRLVLS